MTKKCLQIASLEILVLGILIMQYNIYQLKKISKVYAQDIFNLTKEIEDQEIYDQFSGTQLKKSAEEQKKYLVQKAVIEASVEVAKEAIEKANKEYEEWKYYNTPELIEMGSYELTAYCCCTKCTPGKGITASGTTPVQGRTVALNGIAFGTTLLIEGYGEYIVEDTGGMPSNVIDVYFESHQEALQFGRKKGVKVYKEIYHERPE